MTDTEKELRLVLPANPHNGQTVRVAHFPGYASMRELTSYKSVPEASYTWSSFVGCWELTSGSIAVGWPRKINP
jgi:hypothetical protein